MNSAREEVAAIEEKTISGQKASFTSVASIGPPASDTSGHLRRGCDPCQWESWWHSKASVNLHTASLSICTGIPSLKGKYELYFVSPSYLGGSLLADFAGCEFL